MEETSQEHLIPYLPRLLLEWEDAGGPAFREIDGSMVFVDISGFTKMSERLAKKGKVGAEEVTEILNSTFARLLAVAYENGGTLIKFGGDALLLFFYGTEHAGRAVHAAHGMRRKLAEIGKGLRSSAGSVTLRMSVGAHTGTFEFFLAGDKHRELIVTGPAATETVTMESTADAGEILVSPALAAGLDQRLLGGEKGTGRLLSRTPPVPRADFETRLPPVRGDLARYIPEAIRERIAASAVDPEHRQVTVAFVHFDGTDELLSTAGCGAVAEALHELVATVQSSSSTHNVCFLGSDIDRDGGKIILTAGAPATTGHDEEQMLRALREIIDAGTALPVRIGVNRGHVFAGDVGPSYRKTYTVMGDAVNLAARVMAKASPGEILTTPEVLRRSRTLFETAALEPFIVKGKTQPVQAHALGPICGSRDASVAAGLPLVGREAEMRVLDSVLARAFAGEGSLVEIVGAAGIGKSRLLHELLTRAAGVRFVSAAAEHYEAGTPYFTFRAILRDLLAIPDSAGASETGTLLERRVASAAPHLVPWLPLIAIVVDASVPDTPQSEMLSEKFKRQRIHRSVAELMESLLPGPSAVVIEDAHWLDDASGDLLRYLVLNLSRRPWLICVTSRPEGTTLELSPDRESTILALAPLAAGASAELVRAATSEMALPGHVLAALAERSGGHPLFVQELVNAYRSGGDLDSLPDSVEALITSRIDTLAPADRTLLRYASVAGPIFSVELLGDALPDELPAILEEASWNRLAEFVEPENGGYRFRHMLFRDVAYEGLPFRRRRDLHARIGTVLERADADEQPEVLSLHFDRAQRHEKAWRYSLLAADRAQAKYANIQAAEFYRRSLDAARRIDVPSNDVARVYESLGDVCGKAALYADAGAAYKQARHLSDGGATDEPRLLRKEGMTYVSQGKYSAALRWFTRAIGSIGKEPERSAEYVELCLAYAAARFRQGRYKECVRWCRKAIPVAEKLGARAALAHTYSILLSAHTWLGGPEKARYRSLALPIFEDLGDLTGQANVLNDMGVDAYFDGDWGDALDLYRRSRDVQEKVGDVVGVADSMNNIAEILSDQGRLEEAESTFAESEAIYRAARSPFGVALSQLNRGRAAARAGRTIEARDLLRNALNGFREIRADSFAAETLARLAEAMVLDGRGDEALPTVSEALASIELIGGMAAQQAMAHRVRGYALAQTGDLDGAASALEQSLRIAEQSRVQYEIGLTVEAMARLALLRSPGSAGELDRRASEMLARLGVVATPDVPLPARV